MAREKTWQFDMNRARVVAASAPIDVSRYILWYLKAFTTAQIGTCYTIGLAPTITVATPSTSGGALADATYYYRVAALTAGGETPASNEVVVTISGGAGAGSVALTWTAVTGATGYQVYRGTTAGAQTTYYTPGNVTTWTDVGGAPAGSESPTSTGTWCLIGSSDGITAGMDGLDRWTNTYTAGKITRNTAGASHSWYVLRSPVMASHTYYLLVDWSTSTDHTINITLGVDAPPLGGSITLGPSVQNPAALAGNNFSINSTSQSTIGSVKVHGQLATDGSFNILMSRDFSQEFSTGIIVHLLSNYKGTDAYPVWLHCTADTTAQPNTAGYANALANDSKGLDTVGNGTMRYPDGSGSGNYGLITPAVTNIPTYPDAFDGTIPLFPVAVANKTAGNYTIRGRLQDIYYSPCVGGTTAPTIGVGSVDNSATPQYMVIGRWYFPTDAIPNIY